MSDAIIHYGPVPGRHDGSDMEMCGDPSIKPSDDVSLMMSKSSAWVNCPRCLEMLPTPFRNEVKKAQGK